MKSLLVATILAFLIICGVHYLTSMVGLRIAGGSLIDMLVSACSGTGSILLAQRV